MTAMASRRGKGDISERADRALGSAAGALSYAEGADVVFEMPDAEVGRLIKLKARELKQAVSLVAGGKKGHPLTESVSIELPVEPAEDERPKLRELEFNVRADRYREGLVKDKKLLSSGDLQQTLSVTRQALSAATKASRLFTVEVSGQTYYPAFFSEGDVDRAVLEKVSRQLGTLPGWTKWDFFTAARGSLGDISPLEALRKGKVEQVERAAQAFVEEIVR